tara:strand:- start:344 stop:691 length:348 start_codon:yes stop_codon:yes gene_type:complete
MALCHHFVMTRIRENTHLTFQPAKGVDAASQVSIEIDGETVKVASDSSLASALLLAGKAPWRDSNVSATPRAPYCMMGACFECVVEIDGVPGRQSCLVAVRPGMQVRTSDAKAEQ